MDQIQTFNTIKNVFAALGAKTADNNYAVPLLNKSNASPQGFMDLASLASVLGVSLSGSSDIQNSNLNSYTDIGFHIYRIVNANGGTTNYPNSGNGVGVLLTLFTNTTNTARGAQLFFENSGRVYSRNAWNGVDSFSAWKEL